MFKSPYFIDVVQLNSLYYSLLFFLLHMADRWKAQYTLFRYPINNNRSHLKQSEDPHEVSASVWLNSHEMDFAFVLFSWQKVWHWKKYVWNGAMFGTGITHAGKIGTAPLSETRDIRDTVVFPCSTYSLVKQDQHKDTCLPDSHYGNKDNRRKENCKMKCKMFFPR